MTRLKLVLILIFTAGTGITMAQVRHARQYQIPDSINSVLRNFCTSCHGVNGGRFPRARLNLARWGEYGASKATEKALLMCSAIRNGEMPPESVRDAYPDLVPTKKQTEMICKWAQSLKTGKGRKQPR